MTPDILALVDEIEAKACEATQGEWTLVPDDDNRPYAIMIWDDEKDFTDQTKIVECHWGCATDRGRADYSYIAAAHPQAILTLTAALREAMGENEKLREALKPFSQAGAWRYSQTDGYVLWTPTCDPGYEITVGDLRAARAALKEAKNV